MKPFSFLAIFALASTLAPQYSYARPAVERPLHVKIWALTIWTENNGQTLYSLGSYPDYNTVGYEVTPVSIVGVRPAFRVIRSMGPIFNTRSSIFYAYSNFSKWYPVASIVPNSVSPNADPNPTINGNLIGEDHLDGNGEIAGIGVDGQIYTYKLGYGPWVPKGVPVSGQVVSGLFGTPNYPSVLASGSNTSFNYSFQLSNTGTQWFMSNNYLPFTPTSISGNGQEAVALGLNDTIAVAKIPLWTLGFTWYGYQGGSWIGPTGIKALAGIPSKFVLAVANNGVYFMKNEDTSTWKQVGIPFGFNPNQVVYAGPNGRLNLETFFLFEIN